MTTNLITRMRERIFGAIEVALFALLLALLVLIGLQVFTRYVLHASIPWTEEVARMVLVWLVMLGAAVAMDRGEHYAITFLVAPLKGAARLLVITVTNVLGIAFLLALAVYGAEYVAANMKTVYVSTQVSRGWIYLAMPVGAAIMAVSLLARSIEAFRYPEQARRDGALPVAD